MRRAGQDVALLPHSLPAGLSDRNAYTAVSVMPQRAPGAGDQILLMGAHLLSDARLSDRKHAWVDTGCKITTMGNFPSAQVAEGCKARIERVLNTEIELINTEDAVTDFPASVLTTPLRPSRAKQPPNIALVGFLVNDPLRTAQLVSLQRAGIIQPIVVCRGKDKEEWMAQNESGIPTFHYGELDADWMLRNVTGLALFEKQDRACEFQTLLASFAQAERPLLDCTVGLTNAKEDPRFSPGPPDLYWLADAIGTPAATAPQSKSPQPKAPPLFIATNGVGLGHAQRLSLVADAFGDQDQAPQFAAFPSCVPMIQSLGYDCAPLVSRSAGHASGNANDVLNFARVLRLSQNSSGIVFDGGYPFDSVIRSAIDADVPSIWFRRGLIPEGRGRQIAMDREKYFSHVIVPTEAFPELNDCYSSGAHVSDVGPICHILPQDSTRRDQTRAALAQRFGRDFKTLVVSMLGGGVAADRLAQTLTIANVVEDHEDVLHLALSWPNAVTDPALDSWQNTKVVQTRFGSVLAEAADLRVSACGYNSFHEALYNRWDMIYIPQIASYMDDQLKRATSAQDRGVATVIEPDHLQSLAQAVESRIAQGSPVLPQTFDALDLAPMGAGDAAHIIREVLQ